jgi:putative mRNA 3-end processing factor
MQRFIGQGSIKIHKVTTNRDPMSDLITQTERGLYCEAGDFHIDPWQPVDRALITHAHSDHARPGSRAYLAAAPGIEVLRLRLGSEARIEGAAFGAPVDINGVRVSLHPAGHVLGSAQIRIEHRGEAWVVSGDYKVQSDPTCAPLEPVPCHTFISECTFGLPIYRWRTPDEVFREINEWWRENQQQRRTSIIHAYALGKAQRVLGGIDASIGPIIVHGAVARFVPVYAAAGVKLPEVWRAEPEVIKATRGRALVIAPPSAARSPWLRKFGPQASAIASGWMQVRGNRRRSNVDRGFALSDHADWDGLLETIRATGAAAIGVTHGYTEPLARYLNETGFNARVYHTRFSDRGEDELEAVTGEKLAAADVDGAESDLGF